MNNNLELWEKVCKTDPTFTKKVSFGKREFTTINAQYQIKNATEQFGNYGKGFGIESTQYEHLNVQDEVLLVCHAQFFYVINGERFSFPITASIFLAERRKDKSNNTFYIETDDEAFKKLETDITTKALSKLGFNADVFLGYYDDNRYVASLKSQTTIIPDDKIKLYRTKIAEIDTIEGLELFYKANAREIGENTQLLQLFKKRKTEINAG